MGNLARPRRQGRLTPMTTTQRSQRYQARRMRQARRRLLEASDTPAGQEVRKDPTPDYLDAAHEAILAVAAKDGVRLVPLAGDEVASGD